ncbi:ligand-binding sensor domain-containing protein [Mucilaginibacter pedocola]|uniref:Histidine kinase domain-containing protein n=1 Tax=Mucilaginibacter pedocola TaxID=1792845 RepID=A0A1S9PF15_9SPHI|nr:sensor histidine kinase [Mucilaginibacter pedocola]OOQ59551.1 hypothetical protein BC343_05110 [Mucilaginibacter pedocola]
MRALRLATLCFLQILLLGSKLLFAQTLPLTSYSIYNGLPESTVYAIYIDSKGYLWAGTQSGTCSFDGKQFKVYDSQSGLPDNHVTAITGGAGGDVWFGHRAGALSYLRNGVVKTLRAKGYDNSANINTLLYLGNTLYAGTRGNGLYAFTFNGASVAVKHFDIKNGLADNNVNKIEPRNSTELWLGTNNGLSVLDITKQTIVPTPIPAALKQPVTALYNSPGGELWCGTASGISILTGSNTLDEAKAALANGVLQDKKINSIRPGQNGDIWLATGKGAARVSGKTARLFTKANGLLSDIVYDFALDREHGLWLAQDDGISCFRESPFELYDANDGLVYDETYAVEEDTDGNYWVGTVKGISIFAPSAGGIRKVRDITTKDGLLDNFIYDIYRDSRGNIWIACVDKGVSCYLWQEKRFLNFDKNNGLPGKQAVSINEDELGRIWIATLDNGVAMYDYGSDKLQNFTLGHGVPAKSFWTIHRDSKGKLWFGTRGAGLVSLDAQQTAFSIVPGQQKLVNHDFGSISSDTKGNVWIATIGDGVYKYNGKSFEQYGNRNGIRSNNPYFIFCDKADNIWIGTNNGIDRFDPVKHTTISYTKSDGFMGIETNQNAIYQSASGDLWIGTVKGLMRYRFSVNAAKTPPPPVYIVNKHLFFENDSLSTTKLSYDQNYLTFDYRGLSLSNADKLQYSYKLTGLNAGWSPPVGETRVSFASLPPGKYTFMVQAAYPGGEWGKAATFAFRITPPYYLTWWFLLLVGIALVSLGTWLYRYRVEQLLKLERVRNKIATDLHDDIGSALSSISIFSEVADQQLKQQAPPEKTREVIGHISFHSRAMLDAMDDIVWAVNPRNDHFDDLSVRMREFAIPLLELRGMKFEFNFEDGLQDTRISMEARKNIYLIFKECINNILKHAGAKAISVNVSRVTDGYEFVVADNGKGFDVTAPTSRNGLKNLQKRAAEIGGTVEVISKPGKGTAITLKVNII